jgi:hypothetical protein
MDGLSPEKILYPPENRTTQKSEANMFSASYKSQFIPVPGLILAIFGLAYSLFLSFDLGQDALCLSSGCTVVRDFKIYGFSPWWGSALIFAILAILCFLRLRLFANILATLFLLGDFFFLAAMFFIAPCINCLGAALLIFLTWKSLRLEGQLLIKPRRILTGALAGIWLLLFILNLGPALNELLPAWALPGENRAEHKTGIYFSPSCPACREAVQNFSGQAVFYPLAENDDDYALISAMAEMTGNGASPAEALASVLEAEKKGVFQAPSLSFTEEALLRMKIMHNKAIILRLQAGTLPILILEGLPKVWTRQENGAAPPSAPGQYRPATPDLPLNLDERLECREGVGSCEE